MYKLKTTAAFDSAHFLYGYEGKCSNIHGHHWVIEAEISSAQLQQNGVCRGMVIDFSDLKRELRGIADSYDHSLIYEAGSLKSKTIEALEEEGFRLIEIPLRPTAENFAKIIYDSLFGKELPVSKITVYETPENCAEYSLP